MSELRAESLGKRYRSRQVVNDLSLEVHSGEVVGLLGPNGAGKTTAFYMIVGLVPCDAGRIWLDGRELTRLPMHRRARLGLGYLPQEASVFRKLSVEDNIRAILEVRSDLDEEAAREAALESLLEELHIGHIRGSMGLSLSGGERRRVEIARALATEPAYLLLDEPAAGLNDEETAALGRTLGQLAARGLGIALIEHDIELVMSVSQQVFVMDTGAVISSGTPDEVRADPAVVRAYLGDAHAA